MILIPVSFQMSNFTLYPLSPAGGGEGEGEGAFKLFGRNLV